MVQACRYPSFALVVEPKWLVGIAIETGMASTSVGVAKRLELNSPGESNSGVSSNQCFDMACWGLRVLLWRACCSPRPTSSLMASPAPQLRLHHRNEPHFQHLRIGVSKNRPTVIALNRVGSSLTSVGYPVRLRCHRCHSRCQSNGRLVRAKPRAPPATSAIQS